MLNLVGHNGTIAASAESFELDLLGLDAIHGDGSREQLYNWEGGVWRHVSGDFEQSRIQLRLEHDCGDEQSLIVLTFRGTTPLAQGDKELAWPQLPVRFCSGAANRLELIAAKGFAPVDKVGYFDSIIGSWELSDTPGRRFETVIFSAESLFALVALEANPRERLSGLAERVS